MFIKDLFFENDKKQNNKSIKTLDDFLYAHKYPQDALKILPKTRPADGLIEIVSKPGLFSSYKHNSNGLLITEDGYFITAWHCLCETPENKKYLMNDGNMYELEKVCAKSSKYDVGLAKLKMNNGNNPLLYDIFDVNEIYSKGPYIAPVALISKWDGAIEEKIGFIKDLDCYYHFPSNEETEMRHSYHNHIMTDIQSIPGDSGSVLILPRNDKHNIAGLCCTASMIKGNHGKTDILTYFAKIKNAIELINHYTCYKIATVQ